MSLLEPVAKSAAKENHVVILVFAQARLATKDAAAPANASRSHLGRSAELETDSTEATHLYEAKSALAFRVRIASSFEPLAWEFGGAIMEGAN